MSRSPASLIVAVFFALLTTSACVKLPQTIRVQKTIASAQNLTDINSATAEELEKLPGVGPSMAREIVAYRERYGRFRRAEHLLMVRGISERRFEALRELVEAR